MVGRGILLSGIRRVQKRQMMGTDRPRPVGLGLERRDRVPETTPVDVRAVHCSLRALTVGGGGGEEGTSCVGRSVRSPNMLLVKQWNLIQDYCSWSINGAMASAVNARLAGSFFDKFKCDCATSAWQCRDLPILFSNAISRQKGILHACPVASESG
jgi:hypothetical protein